VASLLCHCDNLAEFFDGEMNQFARKLCIVVESSNRPARNLYQDIGFVPVEDELLELVLPQAAG